MQTISPDYWENFVAILLAFSVLALILERALYQIFDSNLWISIEKRWSEQSGGDFLDPKPWIATAISVALVYRFELDMIAMLFNRNEPQLISLIITGLFLAGGSTGIYKVLKRTRQLKALYTEEQWGEIKERRVHHITPQTTTGSNVEHDAQIER